MEEKLKNKDGVQDFDAGMENIKKRIDLEEDKEKRSTLYEKLWDAYYTKGLEYFDQNDFKSALQKHLMALEYNEYVNPKKVFNLLMAIGVEYEKMSEYSHAITYYKELLNFDGIETDDRTMLLQFIGQCFDKKGEEKEAYDNFDKLFAIDQGYDGGWYLLYRYAKLAYKYRNFGTSQKYFNAVLKVIPAREKVYVQSSLRYLGYIFLEEASYKEAVDSFKKALKIKSESGDIESEILSGLAQAHFGQNDFKKAIKYSKKSLEKPHDDTISERSFFLLAFSYSVQKNKRKEQYYTDELQRLKPSSPYLKELL